MRIVLEIMKKATRPLKTIEYIVSIGILWSALIAVFLIVSDSAPEGSTAFTDLIEQFEIVSLIVILMSILATLDIIFLSKKTTLKSVHVRSNAVFGMTLGFIFVAMLTVLSSGLDNLLWVNEVTMAFICAVLYLNLKVNYENADR